MLLEQGRRLGGVEAMVIAGSRAWRSVACAAAACSTWRRGAARPHGLAELDDGHRVIGRPVVARDGPEVLGAEPHGGGLVGPVLQLDHSQRPVMVAGGLGQRGAFGQQLGGAEVRPDVRRQQAPARQRVGRQLHGVVGRLRGFPALLGEVVGHAADCVRRAGEQVDAAVAIKVHRVLAPAAGHELRQAQRAGIAAAHLGGVQPVVAAEPQELGQLAPEKGLALGGARVLGGEVEGQRGQRVQHLEAAGDAAIKGLDAEDADDDLGRHAVLALGPGQRGFVLGPEGQAGVDAPGVDEALAVGRPVLGGARRRRQDELAHARQVQGLGQQVAQRGGIPTGVVRQRVGKGHQFGAWAQRPGGRLRTGVAGGRLGAQGGRQGQGCQQGGRQVQQSGRRRFHARSIRAAARSSAQSGAVPAGA
mmetsp:Transcript_41232/g.96507  ORF Transcript_41232/g.96507 Transcript_41232/m.96507 type:complete len:418 (+) Transcript_41232:404-1657(+)